VTRKTLPAPKSRDPIKAIRALVWYWNLRLVTGLNDYQLFLACFTDASRKKPQGAGADRNRIFERVRKTGSSPDHADVRRPFVLLEVVESRFPGTQECFNHVLWELLTAPGPTVERNQEIIQALLPLTGFCRPEFYELGQMHANRAKPCGPPEPLRMWPSHKHEAAMITLSERGGFNELALLTALALEARTYFSERAQFWEVFEDITDYSRDAFGIFATKREIIPIRNDLWELYRARIFMNNWGPNPKRFPPELENSRRVLAPLLPVEDWGEDYEIVKKFGRKPKPITSSLFPDTFKPALPWEKDTTLDDFLASLSNDGDNDS